MTLTKGTIVDGYTLEERLGKGGFGDVWRVTSRTGKPKAMKFTQSDRTFLKEAEAQTRLNHPNILAVEQINPHAQHPYILLEHFPNATNLKQADLNFDQKIQAILQVAQALDYAHKQGVIHGDIKPENILISGEQAKLTDFGLSRILADTSTMMVSASVEGIAGTIKYLSPQQLEGQSATPNDDIYSLNLVLFELLAGRQLGIRENIETALQNIPPKYADILKKGLRHDTTERYQTAQEFMNALTHGEQRIRRTTTKTPIEQDILKIMQRYATIFDDPLEAATEFARIHAQSGLTQEYTLAMIAVFQERQDEAGYDTDDFNEAFRILAQMQTPPTIDYVKQIAELLGRDATATDLVQTVKEITAIRTTGTKTPEILEPNQTVLNIIKKHTEICEDIDSALEFAQTYAQSGLPETYTLQLMEIFHEQEGDTDDFNAAFENFVSTFKNGLPPITYIQKVNEELGDTSSEDFVTNLERIINITPTTITHTELPDTPSPSIQVYHILDEAYADENITEKVAVACDITEQAIKAKIDPNYAANITAALAEFYDDGILEVGHYADKLIECMAEINEKRGGVPSLKYVQSTLRRTSDAEDIGECITNTIAHLQTDLFYPVQSFTTMEPIIVEKREVKTIYKTNAPIKEIAITGGVMATTIAFLKYMLPELPTEQILKGAAWTGIVTGLVCSASYLRDLGQRLQ